MPAITVNWTAMSMLGGIVNRMAKPMSRLMIFAFALNGSPLLAAESGSDFSGAWVAWICPANTQRQSGKCSNFVLELFQQQDRLCGAHLFATAGASQLDEGGAPSLTGTVAADGSVAATVESSRTVPPIKLRVELKLANGVLQWRRLDNPEGDYLLPLATQLTKSKHGTLFSPLFGQRLQAVCSARTNAAAVNSNAAPNPVRVAPSP